MNKYTGYENLIAQELQLFKKDPKEAIKKTQDKIKGFTSEQLKLFNQLLIKMIDDLDKSLEKNETDPDNHPSPVHVSDDSPSTTSSD